MRALVIAVLAVALLPLLTSGVLGGTTIIAHSHDGHGLHVHVARSNDLAARLADRHIRMHESGKPSHECPDHSHSSPGSAVQVVHEPSPGPEPSDGTIITLPVNLTVVRSGFQAVATLSPPGAAAWLVCPADAAPDPRLSTVRNCLSARPRDDIGRRSLDRIMRLNGALLV
ncbi:MAG: hypothetical protein AB7G11_10005 [Phycisphaerales bacterium]